MDEVTGEIQQHDSSLTTESGQAGDQSTQETPRADGQSPSQPETETVEGDGGGSHPLEPGGDRFKQVWARAKDAELKLHTERERAARLEGELDVLRQLGKDTPKTPPPKEYTWRELQTAIDAGQISMAQAMEHREEVLRRAAQKEADEKIRTTLETTNRVSTVQQEISRYREVVPEALQVGSTERQTLEKEFAYLVSMGYDGKDPRTELLAARTAFGSLDAIRQKQAASKITSERNTMKDTHTTNGNKTTTVEKDPVKGLTAEQTKHYQRLIDRGVYAKGWDDVRAELKWERPR